MHSWQDEAIVISVSRYGEQSALVRLLTAKHGLFPGIAKGAFSKSNRGIYQPGNKVHAHWQARLEEQLGQYRCELTLSSIAQLLQQESALHVMNAVCAFVLACVPERIDENVIFNKINTIIKIIQTSDDQLELFQRYAEFEFTLLQALGFGLDVSRCAATDAREDLIYVSPKSGRAVSREAGELYKTKLLPLPEFLKNADEKPDLRQILDGLILTGYFLEGWILHAENKKMPEARTRLVQFIQQSEMA